MGACRRYDIYTGLFHLGGCYIVVPIGAEAMDMNYSFARGR